MMCSLCGSKESAFHLRVANGLICRECILRLLGQLVVAQYRDVVLSGRIKAAVGAIDSEAPITLPGLRDILDPKPEPEPEGDGGE